MRPLRDWKWKKLPDTSDDHSENIQSMIEEEKEEIKDLLASYQGLQEYIESGKTPQDFINEYESLGWDIRFCQFRLVWEDWIKKQSPVDPNNPFNVEEILKRIENNLYNLDIPMDLAWKLYGPDIPEEYKTWGFSIYFTDNDFSMQMENLGKTIGKRYLEELEEIIKVYFLYEDIVDIPIGDKCKSDLSKYFDPDKLRSLLDALFPAAQHLVDWRYKGEIDLSETDRLRDYLDLKNRKIKIGSYQDIRKWIISDLSWTEEDQDSERIWCNSEVLIVTVEDNKLEARTW